MPHLPYRPEFYLQICLDSIIMIDAILMYEDNLISSLPNQISKRYCKHSKGKTCNIIDYVHIDDSIIHELDELHEFYEIIARLIINIDLDMHNLIRAIFRIYQHYLSRIFVNSHKFRTDIFMIVKSHLEVKNLREFNN